MSGHSTPSSRRSESPPLTLDPSTLALLDSFLSEKAEEERRFAELAKRSLNLEGEQGVEGGERDDDDEKEEKMMSVDEFRSVFGEKFGMSQFWYSTPFALSLAHSLNALFPKNEAKPPAGGPRIAFLSSPTAYVALQSLPNPSTRTLLFEYDERFDVLPVAGRRHRTLIGGDSSLIGENEGGFVKYDLYEPESFPKELRGTVDLAVIDPPYLNEKTNALVAKTLSLLLKPDAAKLLILTSTSVPFEVLKRVYNLPMLGDIRRCEGVKIEHEGGRIQNDFGMWASWEGGETFMNPPATAGDQ